MNSGESRGIKENILFVNPLRKNTLCSLSAWALENTTFSLNPSNYIFYGL